MKRQPNLPDPDAVSNSDVVIYDGECNFCRSQVEKLQHFACCGRNLTFISLHDPRVGERYPELTHAELMEQMFVVDPNGGYHGGADAIRYLTRRLPLLWPAALVLHVPFSAGLWRWLYRQVAKRRYKLAGKSCENDSCSIHFD